MPYALPMSEASEQRSVIEWAGYAHVPIFHIPNGGSRDRREAYQLKLQGVKAGVPDLMVPVARGGYHGLFVEMKRSDGGSVSAKQRAWLDELSRQGYMAVVCHGAMEAIARIRAYLSL